MLAKRRWVRLNSVGVSSDRRVMQPSLRENPHDLVQPSVGDDKIVTVQIHVVDVVEARDGSASRPPESKSMMKTSRSVDSSHCASSDFGRRQLTPRSPRDASLVGVPHAPSTKTCTGRSWLLGSRRSVGRGRSMAETSRASPASSNTEAIVCSSFMAAVVRAVTARPSAFVVLND